MTLAAPPEAASYEELLDRARGLAARPRGDGRTEGSRQGGREPQRAVLGISGSPGAGKTTLAQRLVSDLTADPPTGLAPGWVVHVPMDGFHLSDAALTSLGRLAAKGAPDTFDADGYAALLERLRAPHPGETVWAPGFERTLEQPIAAVTPVGPQCRLVVSEGNYLLLDGSGWQRARRSLDAVWHCTVEASLRRERLVERHVRFGKPAAAARAWVETVDEPNARAVEDVAHRADLMVPADHLPTIGSGTGPGRLG